MLDYKMTLDGYLINHPPPKLLVLTIDPAAFSHIPTLFDPMQYFLVAKKNEVVAKTLSSTGYKSFILKYIPALSYIYMDDYSKSKALAGLRGQIEITEGEFEDKGYLSNSNKCLDLLRYRGDSSDIRLDTARIKMFQSIVDTCKKKGIALILTYAPEYRGEFAATIRNFKAFTDLMDEKVKTNDLFFYRDDSLEMNKDSCFFRDIRHVNIAGSIEYSKILGQRLKTLPDKY